MLAVGRVLLFLLAGIPVCRGADDDSGTVYSSYYDADGDTENTDFYDRNNEEIKHPPKRTTVMEARTRLKRNDLEDIRTLNSGEIIDVKGIHCHTSATNLQDIGYPQETTTYSNSFIQMDTNNSTETWSPETKVVQESTYHDAAMRADVRLLGQHWSPSSAVKSPSHIRIVQHWNPSMSTADSENPTVNVYKDGPSATVPIKPLADAATATVPGGAGVANQLPPANGLGTVPSLLRKSSNPASITPGCSGKGNSGQGGSGKGSSGDASPGVTGGKTKPTTKTKTKKTTAKRTTTRKTTKKTMTTKSTTTTTRTTTRPIDIDAIMAIISNLTYDYEWNLTEQFNKSIIQHGVPTCPWKGGGRWGPGRAWTATNNGSTLYPWDFENSPVVSKNVDNGCIISPMATLLPVSRGISLYARFHACVCNTNWCNRATLKQTSSDTVLTILVAHLLSRSF